MISVSRTIFLIFTLFVCFSYSSQAAVSSQDHTQANVDFQVDVESDALHSTRMSVSIQAATARNSESQIIDNYAEGEMPAPVTIAPGYPELPMVTRTLLVHPTAGVHLTINEVRSEIEDGFQPFIVPNDNYIDGARSGEPCEAFLSHDGFWPPEAVSIGKPVIMRGNRLVQVTIYPMQYNHETGQVRYNKQVDFDLDYSGEGYNAVSNPDFSTSSTYALRALRSIVDNPERIPRRDDVVTGSYLLIYPDGDGVREALEPLIEWRKRQGHKVILEEVNNGASANTVLGLIEDHYFVDEGEPVEFVALVGDPSTGIKISNSGTWGGAYGVDAQYALIDGDDDVPDIVLGRISVNDIDDLENVVRKIVGYESTPLAYVARDEDGDLLYEDPADWWTNRASVVAGHVGNGLGSVLVAKYVRKELLNAGYSHVSHWYHNEDYEITGDQPFLRRAFDPDEEDGRIGWFQYRAYQYMNSLDVSVLDNLENTDGPWPPVVAVSCNTGDFVGTDGHTEHIFRSEGGGVAAIGTCSPGTHVQFNNINAAGVFKGVFKDKLWAFGWGMNMGKIELWKAYDGFNYNYNFQDFIHWNNLMGDPATHVWTGTLSQIEVFHKESLALGESEFKVLVVNSDTDSPVEGAYVCLYKAGEDDVNELQLMAFTDAEGVANFQIPPDALSDGELMVTVTKHNHAPYLEEIDVGNVDYYIGAGDYAISDNQNDAPNPGDELNLTISLVNYGEDTAEGNYTASLISLSDYAVVTSDPAELDPLPDPGDDIDFEAMVTLDTSVPNGEVMLFDIKIMDG
ncbi:C25 family cysteine peptidase, partial [Calditrichota bacterium]